MAAGTDVERDVGDRDEGVETALLVRLGPDRVVVIARVRGIDRDDGKMPQVLALVVAERHFRGSLGLGNGLVVEVVGNAVLVDGDQAEGFGRQRLAEHLGDLDGRTRGAADRLGQHQFALFGAAEVRDGRGIADALVHRSEPGLARAVDLDDAEHLLRPQHQLLHRISAPSGYRLFRTRQHAVALAQRRASLLDQADARRRRGIVGSPGVGNGDGLAFVHFHDAQHGDLGQSAHAVESSALAVDRAFLGHVLEQRLELYLLMAFEPELPRDFAFADGFGRVLDEVEDLLARRQAMCGPVFGRHGFRHAPEWPSLQWRYSCSDRRGFTAGWPSRNRRSISPQPVQAGHRAFRRRRP